jgi:plastocyanin
MRGGRLLAMVTGAMVTLAACGGGGSAAIGNPPLPALPSAAGSSSATAGSSSAPAAHRRHHGGLRSSSPTATPSPASTTHRPSPTHSPSPSHRPSSSPAPSCAGISGRTTTIQEQPVNRFVPSTVTISRCDSVKAVDADSTAPHTFTGPGWDSGQMTNGTSYTYKFASTGTFGFYCTYHQSEGMTGKITVT